MRLPALVLLVPLLLLPGCSSKEAARDIAPLPSSTCPVDGPEIPASCVGEPPETPVAFPDDASKISPLTSPKVPGELARAGNGRDAPAVRRRSRSPCSRAPASAAA